VTTDPALLGWCAGLIDGEGSIGIYGQVVTLRIVMTDEPTLRRVRALLGGTMQRHADRLRRRPSWYWLAGGHRATQAILLALRPT